MILFGTVLLVTAVSWPACDRCQGKAILRCSSAFAKLDRGHGPLLNTQVDSHRARRASLDETSMMVDNLSAAVQAQ
jgi:hypothetical protein